MSFFDFASRMNASYGVFELRTVVLVLDVVTWFTEKFLKHARSDRRWLQTKKIMSNEDYDYQRTVGAHDNFYSIVKTAAELDDDKIGKSDNFGDFRFYFKSKSTFV